MTAKRANTATKGKTTRTDDKNPPKLLPGYTSHSLPHALGSKRSRRAASLSAFEAIVQHRNFLLPQVTDPVSGAGPIPDELVPVPWWIINFIAEGWERYRQASPGRALGECFDLEGGGQGKLPAKDVLPKVIRDQALAREVIQIRLQAKKKGIKLSLEKVFAEVAEKYGLSSDTVRRAYRSVPKID